MMKVFVALIGIIALVSCSYVTVNVNTDGKCVDYSNIGDHEYFVFDSKTTSGDASVYGDKVGGASCPTMYSYDQSSTNVVWNTIRFAPQGGSSGPKVLVKADYSTATATVDYITNYGTFTDVEVDYYERSVKSFAPYECKYYRWKAGPGDVTDPTRVNKADYRTVVDFKLKPVTNNEDVRIYMDYYTSFWITSTNDVPGRASWYSASNQTDDGLVEKDQWTWSNFAGRQTYANGNMSFAVCNNEKHYVSAHFQGTCLKSTSLESVGNFIFAKAWKVVGQFPTANFKWVLLNGTDFGGNTPQYKIESSSYSKTEITYDLPKAVIDGAGAYDVYISETGEDGDWINARQVYITGPWAAIFSAIAGFLGVIVCCCILCCVLCICLCVCICKPKKKKKHKKHKKQKHAGDNMVGTVAQNPLHYAGQGAPYNPQQPQPVPQQGMPQQPMPQQPMPQQPMPQQPMPQQPMPQQPMPQQPAPEALGTVYGAPTPESQAAPLLASGGGEPQPSVSI